MGTQRVYWGKWGRPGTRGRGEVGTREGGDVGRDVGTRGLGESGTQGLKESGTWGLSDAASSRSGTRGGEKEKEPFSASNESKVARSRGDRLSTGRPHSVCVVCLRLELET